ncbi:aldolase [Peribacillus frigoritolerans]|uniref:aldolase n=1 Tax=Peribacillus frigoritolerans TaxID=450367 RepID=UPI002E23B75A|nr:aldolase [Peribacillus frigoritolerans]MED3844528.1 aldolase [Peribacillus frigoritolerans]
MLIKTEKKYFYKAFGLRILSEIHLPELIGASDEGREEIEIKMGNLSSKWNDLNKGQRKIIVSGNIVMFQIPYLATFCIEEGKSIIVSPIIGFDIDKIRLYLLGTCMGALLIQRKKLPLHGSSVAIDGKAYAFVGQSGAGKSTLESAFIRKGYQLLSDDVIAISLSEGNIPMVEPSYPQQKLWEDSLNNFGMETAHYRPLFERETKYSVPLHSQYYNGPLPLAGVFEISKGDCKTIELKPITGLDQFRILLKQTFRSSLIERMGLMEWHFYYSSHLIKHINMFQLRRPITKFTANNMVSAVIDEINEKGEI